MLWLRFQKGVQYMTQQPCTGNHVKHICAMAEKMQFKDILKAAVNPDWLCINCGRCSNSKDNLCNVVPFEKIGPGIPLE